MAINYGKIPECPPYVKGEARKEYERIRKCFADRLTGLDYQMMIEYCLIVADLRSLNKEADKLPKFIMNEKQGSTSLHPIRDELVRTRAQMMRISAKLGLNPTDRKKIDERVSEKINPLLKI